MTDTAASSSESLWVTRKTSYWGKDMQVRSLKLILLTGDVCCYVLQ